MLHDYDPCRRLHTGQYVLIFHEQFFHTHGSLVNSHFLSTGSSPPEKTIRGKKNDNVILGNLKRYGVFIQPHIYIYIYIGNQDHAHLPWLFFSWTLLVLTTGPLWLPWFETQIQNIRVWLWVDACCIGLPTADGVSGQSMLGQRPAPIQGA